MKIDFHDDHWWIVVNGNPAYRLSIPRDISPEDARKHATNVLIYLCDRAEVGHSLSTAREGTTEGQPARPPSLLSCSLSDRSKPREAAVSHPQGRAEHCHRRDFDEIDSLTSHLTQSRGQPSVGRDPVHASAREDPPVGVRDTDIVRLAISHRADMSRAYVWYTDRRGREFSAGVKRVTNGWQIWLDGYDFILAHAKNGWNPTLATGTYVRRADCAGTLVTILRDVLGLPSPF